MDKRARVLGTVLFAVLPIALIMLYTQADDALRHAAERFYIDFRWLIFWRIASHMLLAFLIFAGSLYFKKISYSKPLLIVLCANIAVLVAGVVLPFSGLAMGAWILSFARLTRNFQLLGLVLGLLPAARSICL